MTLLTSGVMSLCRVYYTQPLICVSTNNQLTKYSVAMTGEAAIHCFMSYSLTAHYCAVLCFSPQLVAQGEWNAEVKNETAKRSI